MATLTYTMTVQPVTAADVLGMSMSMTNFVPRPMAPLGFVLKATALFPIPETTGGSSSPAYYWS